VQEAALCGLPVICGADTAKADERLRPLLLPVDLEYRDPSDVAVHLLALTRQAIDGNSVERSAARSARVSGFYSWPQAAGRYLGLFSDLLAPATARRKDRGMLPSVSRYFLVGLTCALLHNAIMIGGDLAGLHYVASNCISFATVTSFGFLLHCAFTFEQRPSVKSFLRYAASMAANFPASIALMFLFCDVAGLTVPVAAPLATVVLFAWNFLASRWAIVGNPFSSGYQTPDGRSAAKP
jgi:putative flippase GtrA